nr:unnamed protein product [Callosobruchus analis]
MPEPLPSGPPLGPPPPPLLWAPTPDRPSLPPYPPPPPPPLPRVSDLGAAFETCTETPENKSCNQIEIKKYFCDNDVMQLSRSVNLKI